MEDGDFVSVVFGVYLYGFIYYVWLQMVLKGDILYKGFLLLFLASFYLAENLGVTPTVL